MPQPQLLKRVVAALDAAGIEYMLTGSVVSSLQGEPRSTHDIDIVVEMAPRAVPTLLRSLPSPEFYADADAAREAILSGRMFNLVHVPSGEKVDFWPLTGDPFDASRFARREVLDVLGLALAVSRPEDTILAKLRWAKLSGGSEKQFTDALRVYEVQTGVLDLRYLHDWALRIGVGDLLSQLEARARPAE